MKAEELMIGDWVLCDMYNPCDPYYPPGTMGEFQMRPEDYTNGLAEKYKPVPLTSEILKLNGFEREGGVSRCRCGDYYITVFHWNENRIEFLFSDQDIHKPYKLIMDIQFVHQLQHALRLFGINKQIKL